MRLGQGRENVRNFLRENPTLVGEIDVAVRSKVASRGSGPEPRGGTVRASAPTGAPTSAPLDE